MLNTGMEEKETCSTELEPINIWEAIQVIENAVDAYRASTAMMRGTRSKIKDLYKPHGNGKVKYIGETAEEILENFLTRHNYRRGSQLWFDFSRLVMDYAEKNEFEEWRVAHWCRINKVPFRL